MNPDQQAIAKSVRFCGEPVSRERLALITRIVTQDTVRIRHLQRIVNNSRFLILPSVRIKYLASHVLSLASRRLVSDWQAKYHIEPVLLETLVATQRFSGVCYRAANWLELGQTTGRGRHDTTHTRHGASPKRLFVYPLRADARESLRGDGGQ